MPSHSRTLASQGSTSFAAFAVALVVSSLFATVAQAQRVLVVDGQNRPGTNFTDLPAAEAAAQHGDVLDLRPDGGPYTAITTSKALTILCNFSPIQVSRTQPFRVTGLPGGRDFVLQRCLMFLNQSPPASLVDLVQCSGRVHLQQCELTNYTGGPAVTASNCAAVTLSQTRILAGVPALHARGSTLTLDGCDLVGAPAYTGSLAGEGIRAEASTLTLAGCDVRGGAGAGLVALPAPALTMAQSVATIGGGTLGGALVAGGYHGSLAGGTPSAVQGQNSLVTIDPTVAVVAATGVPPFAGVIVNRTIVPALRADGISVVHLAFEGDPTAQHVTLVGLPGDPRFHPAFVGSLWLAPSPMVVLPGVLQGFATRTLPKGGTIAVQVASLTASGVALSNPVVTTAP